MNEVIQEVYSLKKKTLVFVHGFLGCAADWIGTINILKQHHHCICIELPGHGQQKNLDLEGFAKLIPKGAHYIGYSMGGRLGLWLHKLYPELLSSLFLISTNPGLQTEEERMERLLVETNWVEELSSTDISSFITNWYRKEMFSKMAIPSKRYRQNVEGLIASLQKFSIAKQPCFWDDLKAIDVPLSFLFGAIDTKFVAIGERLQSFGLNVEFVPESSHAVHLCKAKDVAIWIQKKLENAYANK
jgi:2-succinyl-6-hydroxy-2,4-cyclohexadiene-1-carboxylate synthase